MAAKRKPQKGSKRAKQVKKRTAKNRQTSPASQTDFDAIDAMSSIPDWRLFERQFRESRPDVDQSDSDLLRAQEMVYDAIESGKPATMRRMARQALDISPKCADAYILLAEQSDTLVEATDLYEQAMIAGREALGARFDQYVGEFWQYFDTRPYMRARGGLAQCLWDLGRREEAVAHYKELLRLNPNDNQGNRDLLLHCLIELGRDAEAWELLERYETTMFAVWNYSRAILTFRREGDSHAARQALDHAMSTNPHVAVYLLKQDIRPIDIGAYYAPGDESEASMYVLQATKYWRSTEGAIAWLHEHQHSDSRNTSSPKKPGRSSLETMDDADDDQLTLLDLPGMTEQDVEAFYQAAADFYLLKPWTRIAGDVAIRVTDNTSAFEPRFAIILGQSGIERGFALYDKRDALARLLAGQSSIHNTAAFSVLFGFQYEMVSDTAEHIQQQAWPIAGVDAYPNIMRIDPGPQFRLPVPEELEYLTECLRGLPEFVESRKPRWCGPLLTFSREPI